MLDEVCRRLVSAGHGGADYFVGEGDMFPSRRTPTTDTAAERRLGIYEDIVAECGEPGHAGNSETAARCRHIAAQHQQRIDGMLETVERRGEGALTASEQRAFDAHRSQISLLSTATELYDARSARSNASFVGTDGEWRTQGGSGFGGMHTAGGHTYRKDDPRGPSWVADMAHFGLRGDPGAAERLHRNNREVATETRALLTTEGAGGEFVPPLWVVNQYVELARAARVTANLVRIARLPAGTDSLNIPKVLTGIAVAEQATQNTAIQNTDLTTGSVTAAVETIAGGQTVALQLIEQSPVNVDQMILGDLMADLAAKVNVFVLNNNATSKKGLLQETGTNAVTFTSASPTVPLFYSNWPMRCARCSWAGSSRPLRSSCRRCAGRGCWPPPTAPVGPW